MSNNTNTATTTRRSAYKVAQVGKTVKDVPYAIMLEGNVASAAPYFNEKTADKKAFLSVSIGIRGSVERLMARANGTYEKGKTYGVIGEDGLEKDEFVDLHLFGDLAEKMSKVLVKGRRVVVSGPMKMEDYKRKDGTPAKRLVINVDNIVDGGSRKDSVDPTIGDNIAVVTTTYTGKDGVVHNTPMAGTVSGRAYVTNGLQTGGSGVPFFTFGLKTNMPAEKVFDLVNGSYSKDKAYDEKKTIINVTVFRESAERLSKVIANGAIVCVAGSIEAREYGGNISYQMRPFDGSVVVLKYGENKSEGAAPAAGTAAADAAPTADAGEFFAPVEDEGDELPF